MHFVIALTCLLFVADAKPRADGVVQAGFIFSDSPTRECHASTIEQTRAGHVVTAWFAGTREGHEDVTIWMSRQVEGQWSKPVSVADGKQDDGRRWPCWNPVLFQPKEGPLLLFYKVGPSPRAWWGMLMTSEDDGKTWSPPRRLPNGILGPIKNKPIQLADGDILCPASTEHAGWRVHFERTSDLGKTWTKTDAINDGKAIGAIQPSILRLPEGGLQSLGRSKQGRVWQSSSRDQGKTWSDMQLMDLPNPNSGTDAVTLADGRHVLVYNHTARSRTPLNLAVSEDGKTWKAAGVLEDEPGEYSYPAIIQTRDGSVHITYTWRRQRVKHVVLDPKRLTLSEIPAPAKP